jgi:tetratricopeptide (TPR) repeat protein
MSVYRRMLGRELPRAVADLLKLDGESLCDLEHQRLLEQVEAQGLTDGWRLHTLGLSHASRGEWGLARRRLRQTIDARPDLLPARLALAEVCEQLSQHDQAAIQIDAVISSSTRPLSGRITHQRLLDAAGFAWELAGDWRQAMGRYRESVRLAGPGLFAHHRLIAIFLAHGRAGEAVPHLRHVLGLHPADSGARVCLGHILMSEGLFEDAAREYEQALCLDPDAWELPPDAARQLDAAGAADSAVRILEKLVRVQPQFPDLRVRLGKLYAQRGQDDDARRQFLAALAVHPDYLDAHVALAWHEARLRQPAAAAGHLRRAVEINDRHVEAYVGLALARRKCASDARRRGQAADLLFCAARIADNSVVLSAQLAAIDPEGEAAPCGELAAEGEARNAWIDELIARNERLLERHTAWNDVRIATAALLRIAGRPRDSLKLLRKAVRQDPLGRAAWMQMGLTFLARGESGRAVRCFEPALRLESTAARVDYRLALMYCAELEWNVAMERLTEQCAAAEDLQRCIWDTIDAMRLSAGEADDPARHPAPAQAA